EVLRLLLCFIVEVPCVWRHPENAHKHYNAFAESPKASSGGPQGRSRQGTKKKIGCFIATGLHRYKVAEEPAFLELMKSAVPATVVPEMYDAARHALHTLLHSVLTKDVGCIAMTTDVWTLRAGDVVTCMLFFGRFWV
ncbi:hypothetical protein HPB47_003032, partial [Ixodes persulcatus]